MASAVVASIQKSQQSAAAETALYAVDEAICYCRGSLICCFLPTRLRNPRWRKSQWLTAKALREGLMNSNRYLLTRLKNCLQAKRSWIPPGCPCPQVRHQSKKWSAERGGMSTPCTHPGESRVPQPGPCWPEPRCRALVRNRPLARLAC